MREEGPELQLFWMVLVVAIPSYIFLSHTRWGRYLFAVGSNAEAARLKIDDVDQADEVHAFRIEGPGFRPERAAVGLAHVKVPVVFARNDLYRRLELGQDALALEAHGRRPLRKVA